MHGVRYRSELAYRDYIEWELTHHEYLGEQVRKQLAYVPTVTRQRFRHEGRITTLIETGKLFEILGVPPLDPQVDRAMICGSPAMLGELSELLNSRGFNHSAHVGDPGDYRGRARLRGPLKPRVSLSAWACSCRGDGSDHYKSITLSPV